MSSTVPCASVLKLSTAFLRERSAHHQKVTSYVHSSSAQRWSSANACGAPCASFVHKTQALASRCQCKLAVLCARISWKQRNMNMSCAAMPYVSSYCTNASDTGKQCGRAQYRRSEMPHEAALRHLSRAQKPYDDPLLCRWGVGLGRDIVKRALPFLRLPLATRLGYDTAKHAANKDIMYSKENIHFFVGEAHELRRLAWHTLHFST